VPIRRSSPFLAASGLIALIVAAGSYGALAGQETATPARRPPTAPPAKGAIAQSRPSAGSEKLPDLAKAGSDIVSDFEPPTEGWNYERRTAMIPMRDGVRLYTVMIVPKKKSGPMPIILTRTPYDADSGTMRAASPDVAMTLGVDDELLITNGYVRVYQDVRGIHRSEGDYVMNRPARGPLNSSTVDHGTDTWDTIDWLVKNVPGNNGKVGITGVSYDGFLTLEALLDPHPALAAAVPMNAMAEVWIGDDWYHNGALRQTMIEYIYHQTTSREADRKLPYGYYDIYQAFLDAGSADAFARRIGAERLPVWRRLVEHPAYTDFWKEQAVDQALAKATRLVPTLNVHGLFDQEDIYGPIRAYTALEAKDSGNNTNFLVLGPWHHGQQTREASSLGPLRWGTDTGLYFREQVLQTFWDHYLKGTVVTRGVRSPVLAYDTGEKEWVRLETWPPRSVERRKLYLRPAGGLGFEAPSGDTSTTFVSDPAKPVPYRVPPILSTWAQDSSWRRWLVDDQRPFATRPDVLVFETEPLEQPLVLRGEVVADLFASTTGADADWVVKLIDVFPPEVASNHELGGYQLMISADIMRGRYHQGLDQPAAVESGKIVEYRFRMPHASHTFEPGHRVMVQVQSSWFPLYDRNPQTWVDNVAFATPDSYRAATHRVFHGTSGASFVELPVMPSPDR
jgi:putative CocE/NonD family hydrolase